MTIASQRSLIAPAAICLSVVIGAELYLVQPMKSRLEQIQSLTNAAATGAEQPRTTNATLSELQASQDQADSQLNRIALAGAIANDEGLLFESVSAISTASHVSLERLDPQTRTHTDEDAAVISSLRCSIEAVGTYGAIAVFVRDLERDLGITFVRSLHIAPIQGSADSSVIASIETEHFSIDPRKESLDGEGR